MVERFHNSSYSAFEETKKQGAGRQFKQQQTQETPLITKKMGIKRQKGNQFTPNEEEEPRKLLETQESAAVREFTMPLYQEEQAQILIVFSELKEEIKKLRTENRNLRTQIADIQEWKESFMETYDREQNGVFNEIGSVGKTVHSIGIALGIPDEADVEAYSQQQAELIRSKPRQWILSRGISHYSIKSRIKNPRFLNKNAKFVETGITNIDNAENYKKLNNNIGKNRIKKNNFTNSNYSNETIFAVSSTQRSKDRFTNQNDITCKEDGKRVAEGIGFGQFKKPVLGSRG